MNFKVDRFPDISFDAVISEETLTAKIYLGFFLAISLLLSFLFGNLLFSILVIILSLFIMLSYDTQSGIVKVEVNRSGILYMNEFYDYSQIRYFAVVSNDLFQDNLYLKLSFNNYLSPNLYIRLSVSVQKETIHAIMLARLEQNPSDKLSISEKLLLRFT